jgi:hypothetical protein
MRSALKSGLVRGLLAPGLVLCLMAAPASAVEMPKDETEVLDYIRTAIESKDYEMLSDMVFWKDTGKIKKRIVRFHLARSLGRPIKSISWEPFPENGFDAAIATGKLAPNMEVSHAVRVIFDEEPINAAGKLPTAVFLVGKRKDVFRIGLVNRAGFDDDDD